MDTRPAIAALAFLFPHLAELQMVSAEHGCRPVIAALPFLFPHLAELQMVSAEHGYTACDCCTGLPFSSLG